MYDNFLSKAILNTLLYRENANLDTLDSAPVKLYTASYAVYPTAQHQHIIALGGREVTGSGIVGQVEVVGMRRPLCSNSVNLFHTS